MTCSQGDVGVIAPEQPESGLTSTFCRARKIGPQTRGPVPVLYAGEQTVISFDSEMPLEDD